MSRLPELRLSLQFADPRHRAQLPRHKVARWIRRALDIEGEITVRIVGAEEARELNRSFRGKDYATNVLTFDYDSDPVVLADLVLNPLFRPEDIEKEKGVILEEIKMEADSPDYLVHEIFSSNFWKDHPLGKPILGTRETVRRFDSDMIRNYYREVYAPARTKPHSLPSDEIGF